MKGLTSAVLWLGVMTLSLVAIWFRAPVRSPICLARRPTNAIRERFGLHDRVPTKWNVELVGSAEPEQYPDAIHCEQ